MEREDRPGRILYNQNEFGMKLLQEYFEDQLKNVNRKYIYNDSLNTAQFGKSLDQMKAGEEDKMNQMGLTWNKSRLT